MPRISVVTVSYNSARTLEATIHSVRAQQGADFEHIIVDGGSSDGTMEIVGRYRDGISAVISAPDRGIYDAMNKGLALAKGTFIGYLNSDDRFASPDSLRQMQLALDGSGADCALGNVVQVNERGEPRRLITGCSFHPSRLRYGIMPPHPAFYVRTNALRAAGGFSLDYRIAADFDLVVRLFKDRSLRAVQVDTLITIMRLGGASTGGLASTQQITDELQESLARNGVATWTTPLRLRLRYLMKASEVLNGYALFLSGRRFPPGAALP